MTALSNGARQIVGEQAFARLGPTGVDDISFHKHPMALTKASSEGTIGALLYPGIEMLLSAEPAETHGLGLPFITDECPTRKFDQVSLASPAG